MYARLCYFDFNNIRFIDQFFEDMADFHYPFSDTAQEKQNKAYKAIASPESQ